MYKKSIRHILAKINDTQLGNLINILNAENHSKKNQKEPKREPKRTIRLYYLMDGYFKFDFDFNNFYIYFFLIYKLKTRHCLPTLLFIQKYKF